MVTEPNLFGLHDLKIAVNRVKELQLRFGVVLNKYKIGKSDMIRIHILIKKLNINTAIIVNKSDVNKRIFAEIEDYAKKII